MLSVTENLVNLLIYSKHIAQKTWVTSYNRHHKFDPMNTEDFYDFVCDRFYFYFLIVNETSATVNRFEKGYTTPHV